MNQEKTLIALAALCAFTGAQAKADIIQTITLAVTTTTQKSGTSNGTTTNVPPPSVSTHTTAEFLSRLAKDENLEGNWTNSTFPAGAKLAVLPSSGGADFGVILGTNVLVDVSDIISFNQPGTNEVVSGAQNLQTGLASPMTKKVHLGEILFDDTAAGNPDGALTFFLQGVFTETTADTAPKNGAYSEMRTAKMTNGTGEGSKGGTPFICTGMVSATGKATLQVPQ